MNACVPHAWARSRCTPEAPRGEGAFKDISHCKAVRMSLAAEKPGRASLTASHDQAGHAVHIQNCDRSAVQTDEPLLPELPQDRAHGFTIAPDHTGHFLMGQLGAQWTPRPVRHAAGLAQLLKKMGQARRHSSKDQVFNPVLELPEPGPDKPRQSERHFRMLSNVAQEIVS